MSEASFGGNDADYSAELQPGNLDVEQVSTSQESVPVPYLAGERKVAARWISNVYNQTAVEVVENYGKKAKSVATGTYDYYGSIAAAVCCGPVDELSAIIVDDEQRWAYGDVTRAASGGEPYRGTIAGKGEFVFYWGLDDQALEADSILKAANNDRSEDHPEYKGIAFIEFHGLLFGREKVAAPNIEIIVKRKPAQTLVSGTPAELDDEQANLLCAAAELLTSPRFGLGLQADLFNGESFEATAAQLYDQRALTYGSPLLHQQGTMRSFLREVGLMTDMFLKWVDTAAQIEAGAWPPGEEINAEELPRINADDLTDPPDLDAESWTGMDNGWIVSFFDRDRVYKESSEKYDDISLLEVTGEPSRANLSRPYITRREQAIAHAADWGKRRALPTLGGKISVRKTRAENLSVGSLFRLDISAEPGGEEIYQICRITEIRIRKTGAADLTIEAETNLVPMGHTPVIPGDGGTGGSVQEPGALAYMRPVELPPKLSNADYGIAVLAQRADAMTIGYQLLYDDAPDGDFPDIGNQRTFGVRFALAAAFADTAKSADEAGYDAETDAPVLDTATAFDVDLVNLADELGLTVARDDRLLVMLMEIESVGERAGQIKLDADGFPMMEILSLSAMTVPESGKRRIEALRGRFGTKRRTFSAGAEAWIIYKGNIKVYAHNDFVAAAANQTPVYFKTKPYNAFLSRDISGDGTSTFLFPTARLFAPKITLTSSPAGGYVGEPISVEGSITDQDGDLTYWSVSYRKTGDGAQDEITVAGGPIEATALHSFKVPIRFIQSGTYDVFVRAKDNTTFTDSFIETSFQTAIAAVGNEDPPAAPTGLTATTGFLMIWLEWINPDDEDLSHIEIWQSSDNDLAGAVKIAETGSNFYAHNVTTADNHYYWIRAVDTSGNTGPYNAGQFAGTLGNAKVLIDGDDVNQQEIIIAYAAQIANAIITDAKIASLSASKLTAGEIGAELIEMDGANSILQSSNFVTGNTGWRIKGDGNAEFLNMMIRGQIDANGDLKSSNYVEGTSGWKIKGDGSAEFWNVNIYGTVPRPQVFAGATELENGSSQGYLQSVTLTISVSAGCTAYYRTDGLVPSGLPAELVPANNQIVLTAKSQLRVVAFEDATSRSGDTFSAEIKVNNPIAVWGRAPDESSLAYIRSYYDSEKIAWGTSGSRTTPPSSWNYLNKDTFTDSMGNPDGYQFGTISIGGTWLWWCHTASTNVTSARIGNFYVRQSLTAGSWNSTDTVYIMEIGEDGYATELDSFIADGIDRVDDY